MNFSLLLSLGVWVIAFAGCGKDDCIGHSYGFKSTWKVLPEKDSIIEGDTLIFSSTINRLDLNTNVIIDLGNNSIINTPVAIFSLKGNGILKPAVDSFEFIVFKGSLISNLTTNPASIKQLTYATYNNEYKFEFKVIAKKKGIYVFGFPDAYLTRDIGNSCKDQGVIQLTNNNINNNLHYYKDLYYQGLPVPADDSSHGFSFKVY